MTKLDLTDPTALLLTSHDVLSAAGLLAATYGGLALAAYGVPRETRDADLAVAGVQLDQVVAAFGAAGHEVAAVFDRVRFGGNLVSRMAVIGGGELNTVDLVTPRSARYATAVLARALRGTLAGRSIQVVSPEDFVILKILSTRDRDVEDAIGVARTLGPMFDRALVERELAVLAAELPDHDVTGRGARVWAG